MTSPFTKLLLPQTLGLNLFLAIGFIGAATSWHVSWMTVGLILLAFVGGRNAGHAFNQIVDRRYDERNPRTRARPLITGELRLRTAYLVVLVNAGLLLVSAWFLNPLVFALAPVALLLVLGYSYTKRFTAWTTVLLGLIQAMVPAAIYLATGRSLPWPGIVGCVAVLLFGTAFETVHSLGDMTSDRELGLHSVPLLLGWRRSVVLVAILLVLSLFTFVLFTESVPLGAGSFIGLVGMGISVTWEVWSLSEGERSVTQAFRANFAFGAMFLVSVLGGTLLPIHL